MQMQKGMSSLFGSIAGSIMGLGGTVVTSGFSAASMDTLMPSTASNYDLSSLLLKRASGGSVLAGTDYLVGERGPELFTAPSTGSITPNNRLYAGGGDVNTSIVINVQKDGTSSSKTSGDSPEALMALAKTIENIAKQTIQKEMRLGNSLNPVMGR
jgi:phage-related minor tail protein